MNKQMKKSFIASLIQMVKIFKALFDMLPFQINPHSHRIKGLIFCPIKSLWDLQSSSVITGVSCKLFAATRVFALAHKSKSFILPNVNRLKKKFKLVGAMSNISFVSIFANCAIKICCEEN
jgi:hypothetical protein